MVVGLILIKGSYLGCRLHPWLLWACAGGNQLMNLSHLDVSLPLLFLLPSTLFGNQWRKYLR